MLNDTLSSHDILLSDLLQTKADFLLCVMLCAKLLWVLSIIVNCQSHMQSFLKPLVTVLNWTMGDFPGVSRWLHQYTTAELVGEAE